MMRKIYTVLLFALMASIGTIFAQSGTCGDNVTWNITNGVLTISGTGEMDNYTPYTVAPWYNYRSSIISVIIENGVTTIGGYAFENYSALKSVKSPNSITHIGSGAFKNCIGLTSFIIPDSVTTIGSNAFSYCSSLSSVTIGKSVTNIGSYAFFDCENLTSVYISDLAAWCAISFERTINQGTQYANPLYYAGNLYLNDTLVENLVIPNGVTEIRLHAFSYCTSITSVTIPEGVTSLGEGAFVGCSNLSSIKLPASLTDLGTGTFANCTSLTSIKIPNNVTIIGENTFSGCTNLTSVVIPSSVTYIGYGAFASCKSLASFTDYATTPQSMDTPCFYTKALANATLYVPAESIALYQAYPNWAQFGTIRAIEEEDGTEEPCVIASGTCGENITWTLTCDSVLTISGTGDMNISNTAPWYEYRTSIKSVTMPEGISSIGDEAFAWCTNLTSVSLPNSVISIEYMAFFRCTNLTSINIPNSVTHIGNAAFTGCTGLTSVTIPNSVTSIEDGAFDECDGLTSPIYNAHLFVRLPTSYSGAYTIPGGIESIVGGAFRRCTGLTSATIPNGVTSIRDGAFYECTSLTSITIPNSVTSIEAFAFTRCYSLTSIDIPNSVTSIGFCAFHGCYGLTSIDIPNSVISIGDAAFEGCSGLTSITCEAITPPSCGNNVFYEVDKSIPLYVPAGSIAAYQAADGWREFTNIQAIASTEEPEVLSIAEAIEIGMALDSMATSEEIYTIEGYVINAGTYSAIYKYQNWYMADTPDASSSIFQAYRCFAINGTDTMAVQNGEKVRMTGHLQKYYKLSTASYVVEMSQTPATILSRPTIDTITVAQALEIGAGLEINTSTSKQYVIRGYVSSITFAFNEQYGYQNFYITDDAASTANSNAQGGFYVYRGVPSTGTSIEKGAFVEITCAIKNYQNIYIENSDYPIAVTVLQEAPEPCLIASGTCGDNLTWELSCDSVLTISGTGDMWSGEENMGWRQYLLSIRTVILPDGLTAIAPQAFYNCTNLQSVNVPNSVHAIGHKAFVGCESLTEPVYNATIFAYMPRNYCGAYSIPEGIVSVAAYAFSGIASEACTGITELTIPSSVKRIGVEAFGLLFSRKITCLAVTPPTCDSTTFEWYHEETGITMKVDRSIPVYVPAESVDAYKAADVWKEFFNILPIGGTIEPQDSIYDVVYLDQAGLQLDYEPVTLHLPVAPVIEGFTFLKWQVVAGDLEDGIYIQAVYTIDDSTDAPEVYTNPANKAQKLIRNGQVYILTGDKVYSISGQKVK